LTSAPSRHPLLLLLARTLSLLVAAASIVCGARAALHSASRFSARPEKVLALEFRDQVRAVQAKVKPGEVILHVSAAPEFWYSRLWQRALYPRNEVIVLQPPVTPDRLRELRSRYGAHTAISAGDPPVDPGFAWKVDLGRASGAGETWLGELRP
jgi:hypothetical protein